MFPRNGSAVGAAGAVCRTAALRRPMLVSGPAAIHTLPMNRDRARLHTRYAEPPHAAERCCDVPDCTAAGEYRAPKARDRLNEYYYFCLGHVREYNKAWDYYAGMSEQEIEAHLRRDVTWQRPTWPMGWWRTKEKQVREETMHQYGGFDGTDPGTARPPPPRPRSPEEEALAVLDLDPPVEFRQIKARYRELVKVHHPDANGGDKLAEERLKTINQAYTTLKASYGP